MWFNASDRATGASHDIDGRGQYHNPPALLPPAVQSQVPYDDSAWAASAPDADEDEQIELALQRSLSDAEPLSLEGNGEDGLYAGGESEGGAESKDASEDFGRASFMGSGIPGRASASEEEGVGEEEGGEGSDTDSELASESAFRGPVVDFTERRTHRF